MSARYAPAFARAICSCTDRRGIRPRKGRKFADLHRVLPGAISAVRKDAIDEAGGLSLQTLAEDTDLTLSLHRQRQRIVYVPGAIAWTEAPETVRTLARQRSRWASGQ